MSGDWDKTPRDPNDPKPGYWLIRLGKQTPLVPCCIRAEPLQAGADATNVVNGLTARILDDVVPMHQVWERRGIPITQAEYEFQIADYRHAAEHRPGDPKANPRQPVDWLKMKPVY